MTNRKPGRQKKPTWTMQVVETLGVMDDFLSARQIVELTGGTPSQISAALHHLQAKHVVDAVLVQGEPFWFLTGQDDRSYTLNEVAEQTKVRPPGSTRSSPRRKIYFKEPPK